jgi:hypothetical protein
LFTARLAGLSPGNRRASGHDLAALIAWPAGPADDLRLASPRPAWRLCGQAGRDSLGG